MFILLFLRNPLQIFLFLIVHLYLIIIQLLETPLIEQIHHNMTEQYPIILRKLEHSLEPVTNQYLQKLWSLCKQSKPSAQSKYSMQIVTTMNQIIQITDVPSSKITILKILGSVMDKCKGVTPRALYQLDLVIKLLVQEDNEIRIGAQMLIQNYVSSYMRIDDVFLGYMETKPFYKYLPGIEQAIVHSFKDLISREPMCVTYNEDNQLLINFVKQLLAFVASNKYKNIAEQTLVQLVNSQYFSEIYQTLPKNLQQTLNKYFSHLNPRISKLHVDKSNQHAKILDKDNYHMNDFSSQLSYDQTIFLNTMSKLKQNNHIKEINIKNIQNVIQNKAPCKLISNPSIKLANCLDVSNKQNITQSRQSQSKCLQTSIIGKCYNFNQACLFESAISLFNKQQYPSKRSSYTQLYQKQNTCSFLLKPSCRIEESLEQIKTQFRPINYQLQAQLEQIIISLQNQNLKWHDRNHYLSQMRHILQTNQLQYLPSQTENVLIDTCYDNKLSNCMLALWGLKHLSEFYFNHLRQVQQIQSTCLMKISDININIRNASRKVMYTLGVKRTLIVIEKLFQKYTISSYYRKKEVLQLISQLAEITKQVDALAVVKHISQHIVGSAPDEYRAFLKMLYFQNERFGHQFKKHINKYLKQKQLKIFNAMTTPSQILLIADEQKSEVKAVINIDDQGELLQIQNEKQNILNQKIDGFNINLKIPNLNFENNHQINTFLDYQDNDEVFSEQCTSDRNNMEQQLQIPRSLKKSVSAFLNIPGNITSIEENKNNHISNRRKSDKDQISFLKPISFINQRRSSKKLVKVVYVKKQDLVVPPTPNQIFNSLVPRMKQCSDWKGQYDSLNDLRAFFHLEPQFKKIIIDNFSVYLTLIIKMVNAQRSSLAKTAIIAIEQFCESCCHQMQSHLQALLSSLLKKSLTIHDFIVDEINRCLACIIQYCSSTKVINIFYNVFLSKNIQIQAQILYCLELIVSKAGMDKLIAKQPKLLIMLQYFSSIQNPKLKFGFNRIVKEVKNQLDFEKVINGFKDKHFYNLADKFGMVFEEWNR